MHIGVDLDNTIVCYDRLFHRVGCELGLISAAIPVCKSEVRDYLRRNGREADWTEIQGCVYGARMGEAEPFPGVYEFFRNCRQRGIPLTIVSHKTRYPYRGEQYDLHRAALAWLESHGFFEPAQIGLRCDNVFLELTRQSKLARIGRCGCTHFIDDLPEFLEELDFPAGTQRILFDPNNHYPDSPNYRRVRDWAETACTLMK